MPTTHVQGQASSSPPIHKKSSTKAHTTKYVYVEVTTIEPEVVTDRNLPDFGEYSPSMKIYVSDIVTITNYTEDEKYKLTDFITDNKKKEFTTRNTGVGQERVCSVLSSSAHVYSTYKEASIARSKNR